ncbi:MULTISPECIES: hypothetical protein [Acidithiobacillus]|jgi:hypothetical protein|uniref:hypothetical protein n=1 Tax=Acidithiobacillus TaxID=119977 RepID=UPI0009DA1406|nr:MULTISPECIES: hypothetical protein [Acidithiobacillus]MDD5278639.1 hypothetical protein [Acidithiobacillus sp.]
MKTPKKLVLLIPAFLLAMSAAQASSLYSSGDGENTMQFGAAIGSGSLYSPNSSATANIGFNGSLGVSCSGINPEAFIQSINPTAIINKFKNTLIGGTQAALENYLLATAYSNPTLASVMNMENKTLNLNFSQFASQCSMQQAKAMGANMGARKMAQAHNECFEQQIASGVGASQAYTNCVNSSSALSSIVSNKLPESFGNIGFLKNYTNMNVTTRIESLMGLLQDTKVGDNSAGSASLVVKPPETTVYDMNANMQTHVAYALNEILGGTPASQIPDCTSSALNKPAAADSGTGACLPSQARNIVGSSGFSAAEELPPQAQSLYVSALSGQIAITDIRSQIIKLYQDVEKTSLKIASSSSSTSSTASATTTDLLNKKKSLMKQISMLQNQVNAMQNYENSKARIAQSEVAAVQLNESQLRNLTNQNEPNPVSNTNPNGVL